MNEVRQSYPFELSVECENAIVNGAFSVENAIRYIKAADREKVFEKTIIHMISMYSQCDITTIPIKQITARIVDYVEDGLLNDLQYLTLCNYKFSQVILHEIEKIEAVLVKNNAFSCNGQRIRERSIRLLQEYRSSVRFSYYNQCIDPSIVPKIETDEGLMSISDLIPWLERQGINRVQLTGEGGMGKTSFLLSLWDYCVTNDQYADYFVNMVKLNRINSKSKEDADKFLLTEFAKKVSV